MHHTHYFASYSIAWLIQWVKYSFLMVRDPRFIKILIRYNLNLYILEVLCHNLDRKILLTKEFNTLRALYEM